VLVGAYLVVRCVHLALYVVAAAGDAGLRRKLAIWWGRWGERGLAGAGVLLGGWSQSS
jgi:hypothetical protein